MACVMAGSQGDLAVFLRPAEDHKQSADGIANVEHHEYRLPEDHVQNNGNRQHDICQCLRPGVPGQMLVAVEAGGGSFVALMVPATAGAEAGKTLSCGLATRAIMPGTTTMAGTRIWKHPGRPIRATTEAVDMSTLLL